MSRGLTGRQQLAIVAVCVAVLGGVLFLSTKLIGNEMFLVSIGSVAPEFHATTVDSAKARPKNRRMNDYRGSVVLLSVWATWCKPCIVEMPSIERLYQDYGPRGLKVVAVSIDDPGTDDVIRAFAQQHGLTFEILHDPTGAIEKDYQTTGVPETFVIGRDGVIRKKIIGASDWDSQGDRALIAQLLRESAG
ncbi:MAG TPA: TlpA disulfide reductase family protein [Gemmatimonadaceae bacterium]|nr:TlpA disulfide reductase family protein [Gemmatimonadaceae bacterium]